MVHRPPRAAEVAATVPPSALASPWRSAWARLSCSARIRATAENGSDPKGASWWATPKSRAQARNRPTTRPVSPAASRWAVANSRTVSSIRNRAPVGVSATWSRHWSTRCSRTSGTSAGSPSPSTRRAASPVNPAGKTDSARIAACPAGSSRFQLQSTTAWRVWCRSGASRGPPRSRPKRSSRRRAISATDITRTRAAASSTASGSPSRWRQTSATWSAGRSAPGRAALARWMNSSTAVARVSSGSRYTDSDDRPSGAQQRRAGTEAGRDAAQQAGRGGPLADRGAPGLPGAEGGRDLADHLVVGGDPGQGDELHGPLLGLAAHRLGEAGLAQAAGTDDGGDAGGAQQIRHRRNVVVAAEQRVGLVRHPVPDDRRGALQQLVLQGLEGGAGIGAELVPQRPAVGLVPGQRRRRSLAGRLAAQELQEHLLVPRPVTGQFGKLLGRLRVAAQPGQGQDAGTLQRPVGRCPFGAQRGHRVTRVAVAARGPLPQRQTGL